MRRGYTQIEATSLVGQMVETQQTLGRVARHARGRIVEALDAGDHWNVLIEWDRPQWPQQQWYDRHDVVRSMRLLPPSWDVEKNGDQPASVEIQSAHDLTSVSAYARRTGRHVYQVTHVELQLALDHWKSSKAHPEGSFGLKTLALEQIWITGGESRRVAEAIRVGKTRVAVD